jgi:hypothetical protein
MSARMNPARTLVMACATVMEELLPLLPEGMAHQIFDFGLHIHPAKLRAALQQAIDTSAGKYETILLGYGMCSQAIIGLRANGCRLVAPRVDDCIAIFLGSHAAYTAQFQAQPGTYFLTKGWIKVGDTPFSEYERNLEHYGQEKADYIYQVMMGRYKRLALIDTGQSELEKYREYSRTTAERFGLQFEEIEGSNALVKKLLSGAWDDEFVVLEPGESFTLEQFMPSLTGGKT